MIHPHMFIPSIDNRVIYKEKKTIQYKKLIITFQHAEKNNNVGDLNSLMRSFYSSNLFGQGSALSRMAQQQTEVEPKPEVDLSQFPPLLYICYINSRNNIKVNSQMRLPYFDYTKYTDMEIIDKVKMLLLFS